MARRLLPVGRNAALALFGATALCAAESPPGGDCPGLGYPTSARVEYVQECMLKNGGELAYVYKCSCVVDWIANKVSYDDFVEWSTFARNASLAGERGGVFRDTKQAKDEARRYRDTETAAYRACGLSAK